MIPTDQQMRDIRSNIMKDDLSGLDILHTETFTYYLNQYDQPVFLSHEMFDKSASSPHTDLQNDTQNNIIQPNQTLVKYYDYFRNNNWQITAILAFTNNKEYDFSDDALSTFAIMGAKDYRWEDGKTKEELNAITEKYFGKTIKNFQNSVTKIISSTGNITAKGYSYDSSSYMILKDIKYNSDNTVTADFYALTISDSFWMDNNDAVKNLDVKNDLQCGKFEQYGNPDIIRLVFEEKTDENGNMYLKYLSIKALETKVTDIVPYS
jgi:hypothetical protein